MASARWQSVDERHAAIQGKLTVATVSRLRRYGRRLIGGMAGRPLSVDLAAVTAADSAGLALLVDWLAWAQERQVTLAFTSLPPALIALAGLSDVLPLLVPDQGEAGASVTGTVAGSAVAPSAPKSSGGTSPS
jgi:phospholipid transport system transporter-binding protein